MKKWKFLSIYLLIVLFNISFVNANAQEFAYTHPELDWFTLETEHFKVHYHEGAERSAQVVAKIAEDIYTPITDLYEWRPDGIIHFIIKDHDDNSNGAAYYYDNKVEIWAPQMTFILRGTHNWLRNVITHEFSHMISLGASRKMTRKVPAFYFQWIGYEKEKRPDVLYGYPNQIASYALPNTIIPMWLAEGMAQFMAPGLDYDRWDSHRDMLIRTAAINNEMHTFDEMGVFGKNSLGNERTYNAGYALTRYIAQNWGVESLKEITREVSKPFSFSIDHVLKNITGFNAEELYNNWSANLSDYYSQRLNVINQHLVEGELVVSKGIGNISPVWSPNDSLIAFCGSKTSEYLALTSLYIHDVKTGKDKLIKSGVNGSVAWSPDSKKLLYQRIRSSKHHSNYFDLHIYDLDKKKEKRITKGMRLIDPDWSADGQNIVCISQKDGTDNLLILNTDGTIVHKLTGYKNGEGLYCPSFSPDGKSVVFSQARNHGRDINIINIETGLVTQLINGIGDARDPIFSPDGQYIYFAWDKTGIFNIYQYSMANTKSVPVTNVTGGAFMPDLNRKGQLVFSNFKYDGYKLAVINEPAAISPDFTEYIPADEKAPELQKPFDNPEYDSAKNYNDTQLDTLKSTPYNIEYGQISFLPRVMVDSNKVKLGTYFYASDVLDRYSILGGIGVNSRTDLDAFATFNFKKFGPDLFLELYAFTRNVKRSIEVIEDYPEKVPVDLHFNILEADLGSQFQINEAQSLRLSFSHQRYTSKIKDFYFQNIKWVSPSNTYFVGNHFKAQWNADYVMPGLNSGINPYAGYKFQLLYSYEFNDFFDDFATDNEYGTMQELYTNYNYSRVQLNWSQYFGMPWSRKHALAVDLQGGWIDRPVDSFFNFFAGGLPGLRGYPFYSIEGRKLMIGRLTYRLPIFTGIQKRFFNITTNKLFCGAFIEYGNAFDSDNVVWKQMKKDVGYDVRFSGFSFYGFPTAISVAGAYSLDKFDKEGYSYGHEWRHYVTLLFDFID